MTFMIRPRVFGPTGTLICDPVSRTSWPRVRPSVESIAIVRTVDSPRCCATSRTRRLPPLSVSSADRISGRSLSKLTSTTAPITWLIRPLLLVVLAVAIFLSSFLFPGEGRGPVFLPRAPAPGFAEVSLSEAEGPEHMVLQRLRARDDLDQLGRDRRLAGAVVQ